MATIRIQQLMDEIETKMIAELKSAKAINSEGEVIIKTEFEKIVKRAMNEAQKLFDLVENEAGITTDRNASNVLFARIEFLNDMVKTGSMKPDITRTKVIFKHQEEQASGKINILSQLKKKLYDKLYSKKTK